MQMLAYDRTQILNLLNLPSSDSYKQSKLSPQEFWPIVYPAIVGVSDETISYADKKELNDAVKQYLPKTKSLFD